MSDKIYQENVRKLSNNGFNKTSKIFINGWSQLIAMMQLYDVYEKTISKELKELYLDIITRNNINEIDVNKNIRKDIKKFLMFPKTEYAPFKDHQYKKLLSIAKKELDGKEHTLKIHDGKLFCMLPSLSEEFENMIQNTETRHLTIINSNDLQEKHKEYEGIKIDDIVYTKMVKTDVVDYTPFKHVIAVKCESEKLNKLMQKELNRTNSLHLTVIVVPREKLLTKELLS